MGTSVSEKVARKLDELPKGIGVEAMGPAELADWRRRDPDVDRSRKAEGWQRIRIVGNPDPNPATRAREVPVTQDRTGAFVVEEKRDPVEKDWDARSIVERYQMQLLSWCREDKTRYLERAQALKAFSPLQYSHLTDEQLAEMLYDQLHEVARQKAQRAVERNAHRLGLTRGVNLDVTPVPGPRKPIYLPGQRVSSG